MEKVAQILENDIAKMIEPTGRALLAGLEKHREDFNQIPRKTFFYGSTDRHQLDVYYPKQTVGLNIPILLFCYGGGFVSGDRIVKKMNGLLYTNVGAFFASRGFITVIPDYRLAPHVQFPKPAEDIRDAIQWIIDYPENLTIQSISKQPDTNNIFLTGHSAGATHLLTMLLHPEVLSSTNLLNRISAVALVSGPYHFKLLNPDNVLVPIIKQYWGSKEKYTEESPSGLLTRTSVEGLPRILLVEGQLEPDWVFRAGRDFQEELQERTGHSVQKITAAGHNHVSLVMALGTGQGEDWAENVIGWMKSKIQKQSPCLSIMPKSRL